MKTVDTFPFEIREVENLWITLGDGCRLAARAWLPVDAEQNPVPAVLEYLPYAKRHKTQTRDEHAHRYMAGHGYACLRVDVRGTGESDGVITDEYTQQEIDDGVEVIDWMSRQDWCDGSVGMMGNSWGGYNSLQVAASHPPALKAIIASGCSDDRYADCMHYRGGCQLTEHHGWSATMLSFFSVPPDPALLGDNAAATWRDIWIERLETHAFTLPAWLHHQRRDAMWSHGSICDAERPIAVPALIAGGWGDVYSTPVPRIMNQVPQTSRAIIGPWLHGYPYDAMPGPQIGYLQECVRWWDHWLKGHKTNILDEPRFRVWVYESEPPRAWYEKREGSWIGAASWPPETVEPRQLVLNRGGLDDNAKTERALTISSPLTTGTAASEICPMGWGPESPGDQRLDDGGSLLFDTEPLDERLELAGAPAVELEFACDRAVGQVAVRLCDVAPDGASVRVTYGLLNLTHRDSHAAPEPVEPGQRYRVRVVLDDIAYAVPPGNRLRVAISTSYWPLVWPAPDKPTLTLYAGSSSLELPVMAQRPAAKVAFAEPEVATSFEQEIVEPENHRRIVERDLESGVVMAVTVEDHGRRRDANHGMVKGGRTVRTYRIHPDDPESAAVEARRTVTMARDDWRVRTEIVTSQRCDREHFHVEGRLEAFDGDKCVFSREWRDSVPRDLV